MLRPNRAARAALLIATAMALVTVAATAAAQARPPADFLAFLDKADAAQLELQNGKAAAYKALWSHADDVTLSGGLGGQIEKGWDAVSKRLDWVGTQFSQGTNRIERIVQHASGDFGYLVQAEHLRYRVPATGAETTTDYRVTMIFRRENGAWKIVHRQADSNIVKQGGH
jgi:ketosteroid isomerase-like protein